MWRLTLQWDFEESVFFSVEVDLAIVVGEVVASPQKCENVVCYCVSRYVRANTGAFYEVISFCVSVCLTL